MPTVNRNILRTDLGDLICEKMVEGVQLDAGNTRMVLTMADGTTVEFNSEARITMKEFVVVNISDFVLSLKIVITAVEHGIVNKVDLKNALFDHEDATKLHQIANQTVVNAIKAEHLHTSAVKAVLDIYYQGRQ